MNTPRERLGGGCTPCHGSAVCVRGSCSGGGGSAAAEGTRAVAMIEREGGHSDDGLGKAEA